MTSGGRAAEFLLVQDDVADELFLREILESHRVLNTLHAVRDVATASAYLDGSAPYRAPGRPDLILLDLNLPGRDGRAFLAKVRADPVTAGTPVILLADSPVAEQILRGQGLPVQGYARKPVDFEALAEIVRSQASFGFEVRRRD
ncbi:response regulator [Actinoplanes sp. NPDC051411]|uniref:response regulator n=1 Tax=Actinoplanes sp. NPDC051411 TaxID=3155522 RepID=UPI0034157235